MSVRQCSMRYARNLRKRNYLPILFDFSAEPAAPTPLGAGRQSAWACCRIGAVLSNARVQGTISGHADLGPDLGGKDPCGFSPDKNSSHHRHAGPPASPYSPPEGCGCDASNGNRTRCKVCIRGKSHPSRAACGNADHRQGSETTAAAAVDVRTSIPVQAERPVSGH